MRVVNALPERRVVGLHSPEIKQVAKQLTREGGEVVLPDGTHLICANGAEVIRAFEAVPNESICYEETVIWGYLINLEKCSLAERLAMLGRYVPVLDNWALCDISLHFLHKLEKKCLLLQRILWLYTKWRFGSVAQLDRATAF